jgi:uncharacterized protein YecT (DUF1311 family)
MQIASDTPPPSTIAATPIATSVIPRATADDTEARIKFKSSNMLVLAAVFAMLCVSPASAQPKDPGADCGNRGNTAEIGQCVVAALKVADTNLNQVYRAALQQIGEGPDPAPDVRERWKAALRDAQRAWIAFRDADCDGLTQYEWWGGSGQSNAIVFCRLDKTNARVRDLKERYQH